MDPDILKTLGVKLTKFRKKLRDEALEKHRQDALWLEQDIHDVTVLAEKMNRGYFKGQKHLKDAYFRDFVEDTAPMSRYQIRKRKPLTPRIMVNMVHKVLVEGELRKDVAKEFRVSPSVVSRYVTKFKNAGHMQRLL